MTPAAAGALSLALVAGASARTAAQTHITTPKEEFGANFGDDYFLASYKQMSAYWRKLDRESDRMKLAQIGTSAEGRAIWMAIITSSTATKSGTLTAGQPTGANSSCVRTNRYLSTKA